MNSDESIDRPPSRGFALVMKPAFRDDDTIADWEVHISSLGVADEIILTAVRAWLRSAERDYYRRFAK